MEERNCVCRHCAETAYFCLVSPRGQPLNITLTAASSEVPHAPQHRSDCSACLLSETSSQYRPVPPWLSVPACAPPPPPTPAVSTGLWPTLAVSTGLWPTLAVVVFGFPQPFHHRLGCATADTEVQFSVDRTLKMENQNDQCPD